ncbi:hypothetical protein Ancab_011539 [Ancistrocladus abbreviatus]
MGFDNECIINIQSLPGEYFCPVCRLLVYPNEALQTQCTHLYCKPCLTYIVSTTRACPYDGYLVTEADSKPLLESNKTVAETIGKISVHCLYHRSGCTWQGPLSECMTHCSGCAFGNSPVVCNRCGVQIVHRQVQEHAQNCPGVQTQAQEPTAVQDAAATTTAGATDQGQTAAPGGASASQAQASQAQASQLSTAPPTGQNPTPQASSSAQAQASATAMPTSEQWYQQQQQFQQYYQQYPGYDPYQQQYQQYYPYQQQAVQQYQQQPLQAYPSQMPGQQQPQVYGQPQPQPQFQSQQQVQAQIQNQPQALGLAQSQTHGHAPATANSQQQIHPSGQPQPQLQAHGQGQVPSHNIPHPQTQPYPHAQSYAQPQPGQPVAQQPMQLPQYPQTHPQMQHPHSQIQPQPYPQHPAQHYPQPQSQPQPQPLAHPPSQPSQPTNPSVQLQAQHPAAHAVTGYQSYQQLQANQQASMGAPHPMHVSGAYQQPQQPGPMQGQLPPQPTQMRPPQSVMSNQHPTSMLPSQVQSQSGPVAQQPSVYPHAQQPGYPAQQRPGMQPVQAASQQYVQQQAFLGQGQFATQQQPLTPAQLRAQVPPHTHQTPQQNLTLPHGAQSNIPQNYVGRPMISQGVAPQAYTQASGLANAGYIRPAQLNANQPSTHQSYPLNMNAQLAAPTEQQSVHGQQPSKLAVDKPGDNISEHSIQGPDNAGKDGRDSTSGAGTHSVEVKTLKAENGVNYTDEQRPQDGHENKSGLSDSSAREVPDQKQILGIDSEFHAVESDLAAQESKLKIKEEATEVIAEHSSGGKAEKSAERKDVNKLEGSLSTEGEGRDGHWKDNGALGAHPGSVSTLPQSQFGSQILGSHSVPATEQVRNQMPPIHYGPSHQQRPAGPPMSQPIPQSGASQPAVLLGHPPGQLRPQGPGQFPMPGSHFNTSAGPPTVVNSENPSGAMLGPGSAPNFPRGPNYLGPPQGQYNQANVPPFQQPRNTPSEPFGGPSFAPQLPGSFDPHGAIIGKAPMHVHESGFSQQRPPNQSDVEMFAAARPGFFDSRPSDSLPHGIKEQGPYALPSGMQSGALKIASGHDPSAAPGMRDERYKLMAEENFKPFPAEVVQHPSGRRDPEDDLKKFPRPSYLDVGPLAKFGGHFPSSVALDHQPPVFGGDAMPRAFDKVPPGFDHDSGGPAPPSRFLPPFRPGGSLHPSDAADRAKVTGLHDDNVGRTDFSRPHPDFPDPFGRHHMDNSAPRSPFGGFTRDDIDGNESRSFGRGSKPFNFSSDPLGKAMHDNRFAVPPSHLRRGEFDGPGNLRMGDHPGAGPPLSQSRAGDVIGQDMLPSHLRRGEHFGPRNTLLGEATGFGAFPGYGRVGEPPRAGNFPPHPPFGESFGGDRLGHPRLGEPGFRSSYSLQRYAHDGGFRPGEMEPFDNVRKRKQGSIMCRICKIDCETVEGLDLHSQTREHQKKAMDMVLSIKQQNSKKKKTSNERSSLEEGSKLRNVSFEGRGNKR